MTHFGGGGTADAAFSAMVVSDEVGDRGRASRQRRSLEVSDALAKILDLLEQSLFLLDFHL